MGTGANSRSRHASGNDGSDLRSNAHSPVASICITEKAAIVFVAARFSRASFSGMTKMRHVATQNNVRDLPLPAAAANAGTTPTCEPPEDQSQAAGIFYRGGFSQAPEPSPHSSFDDPASSTPPKSFRAQIFPSGPPKFRHPRRILSASRPGSL